MRTFARWFLVGVLALDVIFAAFLVAGGTGVARAQTAARPADAQSDEPEEISEWTQAALERLGRELEQRSAALEQREAQLEELERASEVLERAGLGAAGEADPATRAVQETANDVKRREAFLLLGRAYENMEPESAARALEGLASRDKQAVVQLLIGWKPRTSGSILDALTQTNAALAADLSYEIWKQSGNAEPVAASNDR